MSHSDMSQEKLSIAKQQLLEKWMRNKQKDSSPQAIPTHLQESYPLSFAQQRLWFESQLFPESAVYTIPTAMRIKGKLDITALSTSIHHLIERHKILRTIFTDADGQPQQTVLPNLVIDLPIIDLAHLSIATQSIQLQSLLYNINQQLFNLSQGPMFRVLLLRLNSQEHILYFGLHHCVADGWSIHIFWHDLSEFYNAYLQGRAAILPTLSWQYVDYASWQRTNMQSDQHIMQLDYWQKVFQDSLPQLNFPSDHPRPIQQSFRGTRFTFQISPELSQALLYLGRAEGATLFMVLLGAFNLLLNRYSGQQDIVIGTPIAGRNRPESEKLIGCFINTLVLRSNLSGNPTFRAFLKRIRNMVLEAFAHQDVPFEQLVEALAPARTLSQMPLYQVAFALQNMPRGLPNIERLQLQPFDVGSHTSQVDFTVFMWETDIGLRGAFEYSTELFNEATIARLAHHYATLLTHIAANPDQQIATIPFLSEEEHEENTAARSVPVVGYLPALLAAQAQRTPDAIAVGDADHHVSYGALFARAATLASHLVRHGVGPEVPVGVGLPRSLDQVIALLATWLAGGVYVPLDLTLPTARLAFLLADTPLAVLLTTTALSSAVPTTPVPVLCLDALADAPPLAAPSTGWPEQGAYVLYTSGSTGQPKGVLVPQQALLNRLLWGHQALPLTPLDRVLQLAAPGFDIALWELCGPLLAGAQVVLAPATSAYDPAALGALLAQQQVSVVHLVPTVLRAVLDHQAVGLPGLRAVLTGGEAIPTSLIQAVSQQWPQVSIQQFYGPTEATINALWASSRGQEVSSAHMPLGAPITNAQVYLLDAAMQVVPMGVEGEVYLGGVGVARGYQGRADLTAERFVPHPFTTAAGARLYRTGDQGQYDAAGQLIFRGRGDQQVKLRGIRVELGEIEAVLRRHPALREALVTIWQNRERQHLIAFLVPLVQLPTMQELRIWLKQWLPDHMIPSFFQRISELPLTPNGKIDRRALPPIDLSELHSASEFVAPYTPTQETLVDLWEKRLGLAKIGIQDDFFEIGGHSLAATQVIAQVRSIFHMEVPLVAFFTTPTIANLATIIDKTLTNNSANPPPLAPTRQDRKGDFAPLSFPQERIWFLQQLEPMNRAYNFQTTFKLEGHLNIRMLEQTLNEIIRRHEILRTTFIEIDGEPMQQIHEKSVVRLALVDLTLLPTIVRQSATDQIVKAAFDTTFDLETLPLIRWLLIQDTQENYILVHVEHHLVHDGWSYHVFLKELVELYCAFVQNEPSPLAELPLQYADFALWQRHYLKGKVLQDQLDYWKRQLADIPAMLELPTDFPRPPMQTFHGTTIKWELPPDFAETLRTACRQEGVTLFMLMAAAIQVLLYRYTSQDDICLGSGIANRRWRETEDLIGMFVNTLVLRLNLSGNPTFRDVIKQMRVATIEAYDHQDAPFDRVVKAVHPERDSGHNPLFQVSFAFHDAPLPDMTMPDLNMDVGVAMSNGSAKFDMNVIAVPYSEQHVGQRHENQPEGITLIWEYNTDLFAEATIKQMMQHYQTVLQSAISNPEQRIATMTLLQPSEQEKIIKTWNDTSHNFPIYPVHELVTQQAKMQPDAIAVVDGDVSISYSVLNSRANQLAQYLLSFKQDSEATVGLLMGRTVTYMIGALATLKAGMAYVSFDPTYPIERLNWLVRDSGIVVLLTQEHRGDRFSLSHITEIALDGVKWENFTNYPTTEPICKVHADQLAYIIYTSGTTGTPKGTLLTHHGLVNLILWHQSYYKLGPRDRTTHLAGLAFDAAVWELWTALSSGATLFLADEETRISAERLWHWIDEQQITQTFAPTPLAESLLSLSEMHHGDLNVLLTGGDMLHHFAPPHLPFRLVNNYGPTETTVVATASDVPPHTYALRAPPIGRPIANTQVYVLDHLLQPVPIGVAGELFVGGAGVSRGYLGRPDLTAEKFIPNPFSENGDRLYRTGDMVRFSRDGMLEFLGRRDNQVKIRGFRIELSEITTLLKMHPSISGTEVFVDKSETGQKRLIAYTIAQSNTDIPTSEALKSYLREHLPEYMIPTAFIALESWPLTPNGKIDRQALPLPDWSRSLHVTLFEAPRSPIEELLVGIFAALLGVENIGIYDDFFELGGHSLLATRVISRIRSLVHIEIPLRTLFESPTIARLAVEINQQLNQHQENDATMENIYHHQPSRDALDLEQLSDEDVELLLLLAGNQEDAR